MSRPGNVLGGCLTALFLLAVVLLAFGLSYGLFYAFWVWLFVPAFGAPELTGWQMVGTWVFGVWALNWLRAALAGRRDKS